MIMIKVDFEIDGCTLYAKMQIDESLRGKGLLRRYDDYQLHSGGGPSIMENLLFLPGSDRRLDNNVAKYIYLSPKRALEAKEAFEKIIAEINAKYAFKQYRKRGITKMRPYIPGEDLSKVHVCTDVIPEEGGMIIVGSAQWYMSKEAFEENYEAVE